MSEYGDRYLSHAGRKITAIKHLWREKKMKKLKNAPAHLSVAVSSTLNERRANKTVLIICYFFTALRDICRPYFFFFFFCGPYKLAPII